MTKTRKLPENPGEVINKRDDTEAEAGKVNATGNRRRPKMIIGLVANYIRGQPMRI